MSDDEIVLTRAGFRKLERELDNLLTVEMKEMAERLADVTDDTEPSEEVTFSEALEEKNRLEERIARLRYILARATVIDEDPDPDKASPGDRVIVRDEDTGEELTFDLLGGHEVAHGRRGVATDSPVGKALLGKGVGASIQVKVPDGMVHFTILALEDIPDED